MKMREPSSVLLVEALDELKWLEDLSGSGHDGSVARLRPGR